MIVRMLAVGLVAAATLSGCAADEQDPGLQPAVVAAGSTGTTEPGEPTGPASDPDGVPYDDYTFVMSRQCFCIDGGVRFEVTVVDGEVSEVTYARGGDGHVKGEHATERWLRITLDDVIALTEAKRADHVAVDWPDGQDYPDRVWVDFDVDAADEELGYVIASVTPRAVD